MPAKTRKQQQLMAIAEHEPEKLYPENRGVLGMTQGQLHDFAATKNAPKKLPKKKKSTVQHSGTGHVYDFRKQTGQRAPARVTAAQMKETKLGRTSY
jgi:hypothetical protein